MTLGGPRQVALLAFLLLNANRAVSADAVIDAVWGEEPDGAPKRLQMAVSRLRRALEPLDRPDGPRIRTVGGGYLLSLAPDELDAELFAERVRDGRRALEHGDADRAAELLNQALALWRGPPLADVGFEEFAQPEIRRLEELRLVALETRIDADLELGRHAEVIGELEGLPAAEQTRERFAGQLMTALYRSGRQSDALEVYQRVRATLDEQLGLEPGPALKALQNQILAQDSSLDRHDAPSVARSNLPTPANPLVGRTQEMSRALELLTGREVRLLTLWGPGGSGKTRLALEVAAAMVGRYRDGVWIVPLAPIPDRSVMVAEVSRVLEVAPAPGESPEQALVRALSARELLLVLDNFEHLTDASAVVADVLA
ncbi:MAG TPA: BTAD domain-containing putative transcriptional regulator, partial [Solirubrobacteraceae bacterium]|nr:BTAD domain-containing putative transcriptional regulator [Solirubrobacteraceae bacterium]